MTFIIPSLLDILLFLIAFFLTVYVTFNWAWYADRQQ